MFKRVISLVTVTCLTACVSAPQNRFGPISAATKAALQSDSVRVDIVPGKGFSHFTGAEQAMMTTGMFFGAIGAAIGSGAAISSANRRGTALAKEDAIVDPSQTMAAKLRARLQAQGHQVSPDANLQLRVSTTNWSLHKDQLAYFAELQVFESTSGKVLTKGECKYVRKEAELGASPDALLANAGGGLKAEFDKGANYCATYFANTLFPAAL